MTAPIIPAILCGGAGTRLWPLSRAARPKQFHPLTSSETLLAETIARGALAPGARPPVLIAGESMRDLVVEEAPVDAHIVLEPSGRNTAPAAALAALAALEDEADPIVLMLPSDHHVGDTASFTEAVTAGATLAADDRIVTFGVKPSEPHIGYGYIKAGAPLGTGFAVAEFVEKPGLEKAQVLFDAGDNYWNSGIYMFRARFYLDELARFAPAMRAAVEAAWRDGKNVGGVRRLDPTAWAACPSDSIDYAVAEKTDRAAIIPVSMAWSDVGSWGALHDIAAANGDGNVTSGDVVISDARGCYVRAESRLVALVGVEDLIVVETADAVVVLPRARAQDVKAIVEALKAGGRKELL